MTRTEHRRPHRRGSDEETAREHRVARLFEVLLVGAGAATVVWLILSVVAGVHG